MSRRLPLYALLASALVFLASLFLPWRSITAPPLSSGGVQGLLNQFASGSNSIKGWVGIAGDVSVLLVVAIVLAAVVALRRPQLAARLPLGGLGVALGYFAVAVAIEVHNLGRISGGFTGKPAIPHASWTYGFYLGVASAGIAALSALAVRRSELSLRGAADAVAVVLSCGLLISFFLPWVRFHGVTYSVHGIETAAAPVAALGLLLGGGWLRHEAGRRWRLPCAIAAAILTGAAASAGAPSGEHADGAWIGIACAVLLVVLEAVRAWSVPLPALPRGPAAARAGAAALLIVSLFLPWQEVDGTGLAYAGWYHSVGAAAGGLSLLLLATPALPALEGYALDAVVAVAIFVSAAGASFHESSFYRVDYGAIAGFVAAGILLVTALVPLRRRHMDPSRALARAVPLTASALCVAAVVVPLWLLLPQSWTFQSYALGGWLAVPGVLLSLYLVRLWARAAGGPTSTGHQLTLVPLILLTLASLELIRFRSDEVIWGAVILVGLCLLLMLVGWIEEHRGLEGYRVPEELWRLDRLPEPES